MGKTTVLLTGAAGYIGSQLCGYLLRAGYRVIAVDSLIFGNGGSIVGYLGNPDFEFHREDVQNYLPLLRLAQKADAVCMMAALVGAPACKANPEYAYAVNHWAVCELLRNLSPAQRVLYPNTNSGYGATDGAPCTEESLMKPLTCYGATKCAAESAVLCFRNSVSFRLATVYGCSPRFRSDLLINDFVSKLALDGQLKVYQPDYLRSGVHVRDVCRAFVYALQNVKLEGVYNVALPEANLSKLELAYRIADTVGISREVVTVGEGEDADGRNYRVSTQKLLKAGFSYRHSLESGIREVAQAARLLGHEAIARARNA